VLLVGALFREFPFQYFTQVSRFMIGMSKLVSFGFLGLGCIALGCKDDLNSHQAGEEGHRSSIVVPSIRVIPKPVQLSERDCEVIHFILVAENFFSGDKLLYLTPTVREQWNQQGDWVSMPARFAPWLDQLTVKFRPAAGAKLENGYVRDTKSNARGMMVWVAVKEWLSSEEVTVEFGRWGGPLDASGKTITCVKKNGNWLVKEITNVWLS
jgi:hypothetical protein